MNRFYLSSAGYVVDREKDCVIGRMVDNVGWEETGEWLCELLSASPDMIKEILHFFGEHLERKEHE